MSNAITIKEAIFDYIDRSRQPRSSYRRLYPIGVDGLIQLGTDVFMPTTFCKLDVMENKTVRFPEGCMQVVNVGVTNDKGQFAALQRDRDLNMYADKTTDRVDKTVSQDNSFEDSVYNIFFNNYFYSDSFYKLYGVPSGRNVQGSYNVDLGNRVVLLNPDYSNNYIILEYLAEPCDEELFVPIMVKEAFVAYLAWKDIQYTPANNKASINDKVIRRREFYNERRLAKKRMNPFSLTEAFDVDIKGIRLVAKA
jgi:hypothetical protein